MTGGTFAQDGWDPSSFRLGDLSLSILAFWVQTIPGCVGVSRALQGVQQHPGTLPTKASSITTHSGDSQKCPQTGPLGGKIALRGESLFLG